MKGNREELFLRFIIPNEAYLEMYPVGGGVREKRGEGRGEGEGAGVNAVLALRLWPD